MEKRWCPSVHQQVWRNAHSVASCSGGGLWSISPAQEPIREHVAQEWCSQRSAPRLSSFNALSKLSPDITSSQTVPCWSAPSRSSTLVGSCVWLRGSRRETTVTFIFLPQVIKWHFMKIMLLFSLWFGARSGQTLNLVWPQPELDHHQ